MDWDILSVINYEAIANVSVWIWTLLAYVLGMLVALDAIWNGRTSQGSAAWVTALVLMPFVTIPLYLIFGNRRFHGYKLARRSSIDETRKIVEQSLYTQLSEEQKSLYAPLETLSRSHLTTDNQVSLLIDADNTYREMLEAIDAAESYILFQFYIVRDDDTGELFKKALIKKALEGVKVYFIYDEIGSSGINRFFSNYLKGLRKAGIHATRFNSIRFRNRLQLNFRNHRKQLIVDGHTCFIGGTNIGNEYLGLDPSIGAWRDCHVKIQGPATFTALRTFFEDWYWATKNLPAINWQSHNKTSDKNLSDTSADVLILPSGPADHQETMSLAFIQCIMEAKSELLIATPYFVPDYKVTTALKLAALKGVKITILLPKDNDNWMIPIASHSFIEELNSDNIKFYEYTEGFMHQKVMLIDNQFAMIGSANMDNRSMRINFELNAIIEQESFMQEAKKQFNKDLEISTPYQAPEWFLTRLAAKTVRLISPIL